MIVPAPQDAGCSGHFRKYLLQKALPAIVTRAKPAELALGQAAPSRPRVCPGPWEPEGERRGRLARDTPTRKKSWAQASPFVMPSAPGAGCLFVNFCLLWPRTCCLRISQMLPLICGWASEVYPKPWKEGGLRHRDSRLVGWLRASLCPWTLLLSSSSLVKKKRTSQPA